MIELLRMKTISLLPLAFLGFTLSFAQNSQSTSAGQMDKTIQIASTDILSNSVLTAEQQAKLSPDEVLEILKQGNRTPLPPLQAKT